MLGIPMTHQGRLTGVLYLENNTSHDAFTAARVQVLGLLGSQAAIAVENALLYEHVREVTDLLRRANEALESEVATRTEQLRQAMDELRQANQSLEHELDQRVRSEE